ncbi:hypothetical protein IAU59_000525 [Kwoniella sp. CBS 9459]
MSEVLINSAPRDRDRPSLSRPLSEISENESNRRATASNRSSVHSNSRKSRPASEAKDDSPGATSTKRLSANMPLQTITVNLVEYARSQPHTAPSASTSATSTSDPRPARSIPAESDNGNANVNEGVVKDRAPPPPSPSTKPTPPDLPRRPVGEGRNASSTSTSSKKTKDQKAEGAIGEDRPTSPAESSRSGVSSYLLSKRASLRPSSLSISYADVAKPIESPPATGTSTAATAFDSLESLRSASAPLPGAGDLSVGATAKPATKSKPSWLRRASGTAALRSKSRTPPPKEEGSMTASTSLPPALPPRRGLEPSIDEVPTSRSLPEEGMAPPPFPPRKNSYANITAGPSRSRLGEGQGRPAFSPSGSSSGFTQPPPLPSRDNIGNIRGRIAAWTAAAQTSGSYNRSESSNSLASQAGSSASQAQRFPVSAQKVLGHAGSAVQKGWAGLRARGVGGSISSMSSLGQSSRSRGFESSPSWSSGLASRGARDRTQSDQSDFETGGYVQGNDGPMFDGHNVKRAGVGGTGRVFGRDIVEAVKEWSVADAGADAEGRNQWETRRRKCLPAVVVRSVEYLEIWGPKEEGIFRISGRSSHIAKLRKEFDAGADIDLTQCHPGDLDPHAVAGLFKSYLRELPSPLLTHHLTPRFDAYVKGKGKAINNRATFGSMAEDGHFEAAEDLKALLQQLPQAHWFLLADIVKLLDLIPRHVATNRMTQNALMLSLGPSLNISGGVLNELIENRETLFAKPPTPPIIEAAEDLIDFGDVSIEPVAPPSMSQTQSSTRPTTPASQLTEESLVPASMSGSSRSKRAPRLPAKPSLTKIFGSSMTSIPRQKSVDTLNSIVNVEPPRVDVSIGNNTPLPTFEAVQPDSIEAGTSESVDHKDALKGVSTAADVPVPETPLPSGAEKLDEVHYPAGTVGERSKMFANSGASSTTSTPIADRFQGTSSPFPALRAVRNSNGSLSGKSISTASDGNPAKSTGEGSPNLSANPASVIRRGQPVFFQSAGVGVERHTHGHARSSSQSASSALNSPNLSLGSPAFGSPNPNSNGDSQFGDTANAGQKRKDEGERARNGDAEGDGEGNRAKRLSAGPGTLGGVETGTQSS